MNKVLIVLIVLAAAFNIYIQISGVTYQSLIGEKTLEESHTTELENTENPDEQTSENEDIDSPPSIQINF